MQKHFKAYLAIAFFISAAGRYQPVYAGEDGAAWGAAIGAFIGAFFGHTIEEVAKETPPHGYVLIDKEQVKSKIESKIDNLCQTYRQSYIDKQKIRSLKSQVTRNVYNKIDSTCYASQAQANRDSDKQAEDMVAQYIAGLAKIMALQKGQEWRSQPPINPQYVNDTDPETFARNIAQKIAGEVQHQYERNYRGALQHYWGNPLKSKITTLAQQHYERSTPKSEPMYKRTAIEQDEYIDCAKIEQNMMARIDKLCATHQQSSYKQAIIAEIKRKARAQLMYDIRRRHYTSHKEAQADAVQKLNSFLPEILQDYVSDPSQKARIKYRAIEELERNAANGLKFLISDKLY